LAVAIGWLAKFWWLERAIRKEGEGVLCARVCRPNIEVGEVR